MVGELRNTSSISIGHKPSGRSHHIGRYFAKKVQDVEFYFYTIKGLNPRRKYKVWIYGQNRFGWKGDDSRWFTMTPGANRKNFVYFCYLEPVLHVFHL